MTAGTLVIETVEGKDGVWLVADYGSIKTPLARFESEGKSRLFTELLALSRAVSHAQGQLGI